MTITKSNLAEAVYHSTNLRKPEAVEAIENGDFDELKNSGFGQNELGARYLIASGKYYFSGQTLIAFPLDAEDDGEP